MSKFIFGYTEKCCKCGGIATNWQGWLRKSRDGINAGFCDTHRPAENSLKSPAGIYHKGLGFSERKPRCTVDRLGLHKNVIEQ